MTASRLRSLFARIFLFSGSPVELSLNLSILYCWFMRLNGLMLLVIFHLHKSNRMGYAAILVTLLGMGFFLLWN